jgi:predicted amidohydrolase
MWNGLSLVTVDHSGSLNVSITYAIEGGCFVIHACATLGQNGVDIMRTRDGDKYYASGGGGSCVVRLDGKIMTDKLPEDEGGVIIADLDFDGILRSEAYLETQCHYSRSDLSCLGVDARVKPRVKHWVA